MMKKAPNRISNSANRTNRKTASTALVRSDGEGGAWSFLRMAGEWADSRSRTGKAGSGQGSREAR